MGTTILDEIFSLHGNYQDDLLKSICEKILMVHRHGLMTEKIADAVTLMLILVHEKECRPFEVAREIASTTLHRLENSKDLDFEEIMIGAYLINYSNNFSTFSQRLLDELAEYKGNPSYDDKRKGTKLAIHLNSLLFEIRSDKPCEDNFEFHYYALLKMCGNNKRILIIYKNANQDLKP